MQATNKVEQADVLLIIGREFEGIGVFKNKARRRAMVNPLTEMQLRKMIAKELGLPIGVFQTKAFRRALRWFEERIICELSYVIRIKGGDKTFPLYLP